MGRFGKSVLRAVTALAAVAAVAVGSQAQTWATSLNTVVTTITGLSSPVPVASANGLAFVANYVASGSVSVIDAQTNQLVGSPIPVGRSPEFLAVSGGRLYVSNPGSNTVSVIDIASRSVTATLSVGPSPQGLAVTGGRLYVALFNGDVEVYDAATNTLVTTVTITGNLFGLVASGGFVYVGQVVSAPNPGIVHVIDTSTNAVTTTITVGRAPQNITAAGGYVYVANTSSNNVSVIDTGTRAVTATIAVGSAPYGVAVTNGSAYVTNSSGFSNSVSVIDLSTNSVTDTISVGRNPLGIAIENGYAYVANSSDGSVSVIEVGPHSGGTSSTSGSSPRTFTFTFRTADGGDCFTDSNVVAGPYQLPGSSVACTPEGTELVGWSIPGQRAHFSDGGTVIASADQTFTAVAKYPKIAVTYDPNVGRVSANDDALTPCLTPQGVNVNTALHAGWTTQDVSRDGVLSAAPLCAPPGLKFLGWTDQPTTSGVGTAVDGAMTLAPGALVPAVWNQDPDPVNEIHLYALWGR